MGQNTRLPGNGKGEQAQPRVALAVRKEKVRLCGRAAGDHSAKGIFESYPIVCVARKVLLNLAGDLHALVDKSADTELAAQTNVAFHDLAGLGDAEVGPRCQAIVDLTKAHAAELTESGMQAADLEAAQNAIDAYSPTARATPSGSARARRRASARPRRRSQDCCAAEWTSACGSSKPRSQGFIGITPTRAQNRRSWRTVRGSGRRRRERCRWRKQRKR